MTTPPSITKRAALILVGLTLASLACIQVDLSPAPVVVASPTPTSVPLLSPTPVVWPTFSPRPTPAAQRDVLNTIAEPKCPLPDLGPDQHISASGSYTVTESATVGRMLCHIKRNSCAYHLLVGKIDPTIVYKQEESAPYNLEDLLIHPALVQPLTRLNELVLAEWKGEVQLRITDAYDSLLEHDPPESEPKYRYSLHYEGRAVDLTTWPTDYGKYGRLCALARCAGFDWVHNEQTHCHASLKAVSLCTQCSD